MEVFIFGCCTGATGVENRAASDDAKSCNPTGFPAAPTTPDDFVNELPGARVVVAAGLLEKDGAGVM